MADKTGIEWTEATWNPVVGCSIVSPGCTNCYAMGEAARIQRMAAGAGRASHYDGTTQASKAGPVWTGKLTLAPDHILTQPMRWTRPRTIFVNSMGDLFHEDVPDSWIDQVFAVMAQCPQHIFQVLTKRADRMRAYFNRTQLEFHIVAAAVASVPDFPAPARWPHLPLPNVWLGVSAERQQEAHLRIPDLLSTPAAIRFVSAEPLLGPIDFRFLHASDANCEINALAGTHGVNRPHGGLNASLDWIIVGGESGKAARPMHPDWVSSIRDQCAAAGTAFFFKQWGSWGPIWPGAPTAVDPIALANDGARYQFTELAWPDGPRRGEAVRAGHDKANLNAMYRMSKKLAGRELDGRTHSEMPGKLERPL